VSVGVLQPVSGRADAVPRELGGQPTLSILANGRSAGRASRRLTGGGRAPARRRSFPDQRPILIQHPGQVRQGQPGWRSAPGEIRKGGRIVKTALYAVHTDLGEGCTWMLFLGCLCARRRSCGYLQGRKAW